MELTSGLLSRGEYLQAIVHAADFLLATGVEEILVAYGFGCDRPDEQLHQDRPMPLDRLRPFLEQAEADDFYRVGQDNLHVHLPGRDLEFMFCHESDIHFIGEDVELVGRLKAEWSAMGYPKQAGALHGTR